jgi:N-methylhydantoinase A
LLNAAVGPRMETYLEGFLSRVKNLGIAVEPFTIHSNGGLMSMRAVRAYPVRTCLSGPAAGVVGAAEIGRVGGFENLVTFDVGGTSTDVSLVYRGKPLFSSSRLVADYPVKTPMIDIHVIGAGGGSIAWMDDAGALESRAEKRGCRSRPGRVLARRRRADHHRRADQSAPPESGGAARRTAQGRRKSCPRGH